MCECDVLHGSVPYTAHVLQYQHISCSARCSAISAPKCSARCSATHLAEHVISAKHWVHHIGHCTNTHKVHRGCLTSYRWPRQGGRRKTRRSSHGIRWCSNWTPRYQLLYLGFSTSAEYLDLALPKKNQKNKKIGWVCLFLLCFSSLSAD